MKQLPLGIKVRTLFDFDGFVATGNEQLIAHLRAQAHHPDPHSNLYFWGGAGFGKTHLLQAVCHEALLHQHTAIYLSCGELLGLPLTALEDLESYSIVCFDDLQLVAGHPHWEMNLFDFYNRCRDEGACFLSAATVGVSGLGYVLADLTSRLSASVSYNLKPLNDLNKMEVLVSAAKDRGMCLSLEVAQFLLHRCPRDMHLLFKLLDDLDRASLSQKRKLTIPFVKEALVL
jgi:DnaA family protein